MGVKTRNARKVVIYTDPTRYNAHIGATQLTDGEVVVVFNQTRGMRHEDFDSVMLVRSTDNGSTWDPETKTTVWPCTHHFGSDTPSIAQLSDGTLLVNFLKTAFYERKGIYEDFGPQSERLAGLMEAQGPWITTSADNGYTWEPAYGASVAPMRSGQPIDAVTELPNGVLLMALLGQMRTRYWRPDEEASRSFVIRSDNGGLDWEYWSTIAYDPAGIISFDEPAMERTAQGTLVCMMRTEHLPRMRHQHMWVAYSHNDGESWSRPEPTNIWGYPADLTPLQDGRVLCTYGYRRGEFGIRVCLSEDGEHWDVADEFVVSQGGQVSPTDEARSWYHIGYPTSVQLADGTILSVFHEWTQQPPFIQQVVGVLYEIE